MGGLGDEYIQMLFGLVRVSVVLVVLGAGQWPAGVCLTSSNCGQR